MNHFIKARLNKDNFWNLMFAILMVVGSMTIGFFVSLIIGLFMVKYFAGVSVQGKRIFNSQGKAIKKKQISGPMVIFVFTGILGGWTKLILASPFIFIPVFLSKLIFCFVVVFIPVTIFILFNCPISIIFTKTFWKPGPKSDYTPVHRSSESSVYYPTKSLYSGLPGSSSYRK